MRKRDKSDAYDYFSFKNELKFSDKEFPMVSVAKKKTLMFWSFLPKIRCIAWKLKREMKCYKVNDVAFFVHHNAFLFSLKQRKALAEEQRKCLLCPKVDWKNEHNLMIVSVSFCSFYHEQSEGNKYSERDKSKRYHEQNVNKQTNKQFAKNIFKRLKSHFIFFR